MPSARLELGPGLTRNMRPHLPPSGKVSPRLRAGIQGETIPAAQVAASSTPAFDNFVAPAPLGRDAAEPSIGVNWTTGNVMFQAYTETLRVSFDDSTSPATATWADVTAPNAVFSMDPILFTDPVTGRTAVSQLVSSLLVPGGGCSLSAVTDDDGETWIPSTGCGAPGAYDHQTIGGGAYADPDAHPVKATDYDRGMYYCGQSGFFANCALSTDGGITYGAGVPTYTDIGSGVSVGSAVGDPGASCMGLHGHIKVGPDGTAYLPNFNCHVGDEDLQAVVVSEDDGMTWEARTLPGAEYNGFKSDPSVGIATDNTVYFAYEDKTGPIKVAVSTDKGETWSEQVDVGAELGVAYGVFPAVVAGDGDRAAVAFIGTTDRTESQFLYEDQNYAGAWHLYVATTYDRGQTWTTVDVTPTDPVQRGCVWWGNAGGCPSAQRNLLDFMDAQLDEFGRVLVGYADGCVNACVQGPPNTREDIGAIARQSGGLSLFSEFDSMFGGN